ncbi:hypothetical protein SAMN06265379_11155 [Saccharicrinis carchari]|uniref:Uncharacterized protein n=1 Tax=Saccharicrinis carchari TaxID=1168039 RepID=A0A521EWM1_SACCC|nr:hypothetical protein [Saccharicrinis carchari]SMO87510.1 hypothetical protein SAMN06265379_11155 [Saccharicrinis carchari]
MPIKINTVHTIKKQLQLLPKEVVIAYCMRLVKYKKDNKELLNYLLFEQDYEADYINEIKADIKAAFIEINRETFYYAKKNIRMILKTTTKHIKYSGKKETAVELLLFFCLQMKSCGVSFKESRVMTNLYQRQLTNIEKALDALHEDIRIDYEEELNEVKKGLL